jgi:hypothetical protein
MQLRQHHCIAMVGLHPVAGFHRDQRWRHYDAVMAHLDKLAIEAIAAGACFIAEMLPCPLGRQLFHQIADLIRAVRHLP